jgi:hypothetical protein
MWIGSGDGERAGPRTATRSGPSCAHRRGWVRRLQHRRQRRRPTREGVSGEIACPVFVEGDTVDIRCDGETAAAVRAVSGDWYASTGPDGLLIWVKEGKATAALFPPGIHWSELGGRVLPRPAAAPGASRCSVRLLVAARARKECPEIEVAERLAMTSHFDPPCIEGGPWPVQVDIPVSAP